MQVSNFSNAPQLTDAALVAEFQLTSDSQVFAELYNRYFDKVKIYCIKALGDEQNALDAAQDVFLKAYEKLDSLLNPQLWVAWLFSIARNQVLNLHKQQSHNHLEPVETCFTLADEPSDLDAMRELDRKLVALPRLLDKAPEGRILKLKYVEGRSIDQLCEDLHMNKSAVKMRLLRARQTVVELYERQAVRA
ncbi:MAG: sigma-70 family RNA polymerase sigma factor [Bacteroidetes bacterium]|nr:sigma-70 family RNA polymerase sigma factor [Bacteroidota bacterium]